MYWDYERLNTTTGELETCPVNDNDGSITGHVIIDLKAWFDENPEIRIAQGWTKHIHYDRERDPDIYPQFNRQTHFVLTGIEQVDEHTIKDVYHVLPKTEEMLLYEEMNVRYNSSIVIM